MAKYVIKNNLPNDFLSRSIQHSVEDNKELARLIFKDIVEILYLKWPIKVTFQEEEMRGTIQVEIDGFYYYVELYKTEA